VVAEHERPWHPLTPQAVAAIFAAADFPWWIAGGFALDHFAGQTLRPHGDIDVLVLRTDGAAMGRMLGVWDCWMADPPGTLRPWAVEAPLPPHVTDVWCRETGERRPWRFQVMIDESEGSHWRSRRAADVTRPIAELGTRDAQAIPFLAPEVQLFYKAKAPRPKDEIDFRAVWPLLSRSQQAWLKAAIATAYGEGNAWLSI
jgi:hypothetical protein